MYYRRGRDGLRSYFAGLTGMATLGAIATYGMGTDGNKSLATLCAVAGAVFGGLTIKLVQDLDIHPMKFLGGVLTPPLLAVGILSGKFNFSSGEQHARQAAVTQTQEVESRAAPSGAQEVKPTEYQVPDSELLYNGPKPKSVTGLPGTPAVPAVPADPKGQMMDLEPLAPL